MNPRFEVNDKVVDANGRMGYVRAVTTTLSGFTYEITWREPRFAWGEYDGNVASTFKRVGTSWNRLMAPPEDDYGDGEA